MVGKTKRGSRQTPNTGNYAPCFDLFRGRKFLNGVKQILPGFQTEGIIFQNRNSEQMIRVNELAITFARQIAENGKRRLVM